MMFIDIHTHQTHTDQEIYSIKNHIIDKDIFDNKTTCSVGIHPWYLDTQNVEKQLNTFTELLKFENVIAVGEIGLDKKINTDFKLQEDIFVQQILLAAKYQKPIIVHCVKAFSEIIAIKKRLKVNVPMIIHGFNNNENILKEVLKNGFYISLGAAVLNKKSNAFAALKWIPDNILFLETDDQTIDIKIIYENISSIKNILINDFESIINENFNNIFKIKKNL